MPFLCISFGDITNPVLGNCDDIVQFFTPSTRAKSVVRITAVQRQIMERELFLPFLIEHGFVIDCFTRVKMDPSAEGKTKSLSVKRKRKSIDVFIFGILKFLPSQ